MQTLPFLVNAFGDRYLYDVNRGVFNQIGAANLYKQRFGEHLFDEDSLTIVVGTDSGLLPRLILDRGIPDGSRFLFIEHPDLLPTIGGAFEDDAFDEKLLLTDDTDLGALLKDIRFSDYANIGNVRLLASIGASDDFFGKYRELFTTIKQQVDSILWVHNVQLSNPSFVRRQLQNLVEEHVPAKVLENAFSGRMAVLLGGGPSLDEILPWVREHQGDLLIIAVSRVCRRLQQAGVLPHLVVSIDPTDLSFDISKEFLELDPRAVLAFANHVSFPLLAQWRGRSVYLDRRFPWGGSDEPENIGSAGPTVTNTAFDLARQMGLSTVVFAGIDLCHSSEGYTHARGSNEFDAGPALAAGVMRVPTNGGRMAQTTPDFFNAIKGFSAQAQAARKQGMQVINPANGAARIDGVDHIPLEEIAVETADPEPFEVLHRLIDSDSLPGRNANLLVMQRELARAHNGLRAIVKLAEEALRCNDGLFGRNGKTADYRHKKRMDRIERQLDTRHGDFSRIVRMFSARAFLHMPPSEREWSDDEIEQAGRTYYTAYRDNARQLIELVESAQRRIAWALDEDLPQPDFEHLARCWREDGIPGRALVWLYRHREGADRLPQSTQQLLHGLEQEYRAVLAQRDTSHAQKKRDEATLGPVRGKLQILFKERNRDELKNMIRQLDRLADTEARQLCQLGRGFMAELDGDPELAFATYAVLIDMARDEIATEDQAAANPRLEDALRRMLVIAMNGDWRDQALLLLETLAGMSPAYEPQFAELLRLSGQTEAAISVYSDYLSKAPGDHIAMLRLGKLYHSIGAEEAARTAFNYILEQEPDNRAARTLLNEIESAA